MAAWLVIEAPDSGEVHVAPIDDVVAHSYDDCACGTTTEPVPRDDGSIGWLVTHHSLDGREQHE